MVPRGVDQEAFPGLSPKARGQVGIPGGDSAPRPGLCVGGPWYSREGRVGVLPLNFASSMDTPGLGGIACRS